MRESEIRFLGDVQTLRLRPSDVVVLTAMGHVTIEQAERIRAEMKRFLPNNECVVLSDGLKLGVLEHDSGAAPRAVAA